MTNNNNNNHSNAQVIIVITNNDDNIGGRGARGAAWRRDAADLGLRAQGPEDGLGYNYY